MRNYRLPVSYKNNQQTNHTKCTSINQNCQLRIDTDRRTPFTHILSQWSSPTSLRGTFFLKFPCVREPGSHVNTMGVLKICGMRGMISKFAERRVRVCVWVNSSVQTNKS